MSSKVYNLFISHSWAYSDAYEKLVSLLDNATYFSYRNYSVPRDDPIHNAPTSAALYNAIKQQMSNCHIVLIMAGVYSTYSTWIEREIEIAQIEYMNPKPIIGIKPWAQTRISAVVQEASDEIVAWSTNSIVRAIREHSL
jgi:hypothetical protein